MQLGLRVWRGCTSEEKVISRGDDDDVVILGVEALEERRASPSAPKDNKRLLLDIGGEL